MSRQHGVRLGFGSARAVVGVALALTVLIAGCGDDTSTLDDAGVDDAALSDAGPACTVDADCDDGLACNGTESCESGQCVAGVALDCNDGIACTSDRCSEELRRCVNQPPDADGDGIAAATCLDARGEPLGTDCDDTDALAFPGATEVCDAVRDEDCDPTTLGPDADNDTFVDATCCNGATCGRDCNDAVPSIHPGAAEICNRIDDDCNEMIDDGVAQTVYRDRDGDGYGAGPAETGCGAVAGFSVYDTDCNDTPAEDATDTQPSGLLQSPALLEVCDEIDNDCDGDEDDNTVEANWYLDADGDGFGSSATVLRSCARPSGSYSLLGTDCNDGSGGVNPAQAERCNGVDDDCNGSADYRIAAGDLEDDDRDGIADTSCTPAGSDCNDLDASSGPGIAESCDGRDNDCDGNIDEAIASFAYYRDSDGDGYGSDISGVVVGCVPVSGYVRRGGDCDDTSATRSPGSREACDGVDDDCDAAIDEQPASSADCPSVANQDYACVVGTCIAVGCSDGFGNCNGRRSDGCEANFATDAANCGDCGLYCAGGDVCYAGICQHAVVPVTSGLTAHFDTRVDASVELSGSSISRWLDLSGSGHHLVRNGSPPEWAYESINGFNGLALDGTGMRSESTFTSSTNATVFAVVRISTPDTSSSLFAHGDWAMRSQGAPTLSFGGASDTLLASNTISTGVYLFVGRTDGTGRYFGTRALYGSVVEASGMGPAGVPTDGYFFVGSADGTTFANLSVGEILYYDRALTDAERDTVIQYFVDGWYLDGYPE